MQSAPTSDSVMKARRFVRSLSARLAVTCAQGPWFTTLNFFCRLGSTSCVLSCHRPNTPLHHPMQLPCSLAATASSSSSSVAATAADSPLLLAAMPQHAMCDRRTVDSCVARPCAAPALSLASVVSSSSPSKKSGSSSGPEEGRAGGGKRQDRKLKREEVLHKMRTIYRISHPQTPVNFKIFGVGNQKSHERTGPVCLYLRSERCLAKNVAGKGETNHGIRNHRWPAWRSPVFLNFTVLMQSASEKPIRPRSGAPSTDRIHVVACCTVRTWQLVGGIHEALEQDSDLKKAVPPLPLPGRAKEKRIHETWDGARRNERDRRFN